MKYLERRGLPSGGYAWNVEDDDTKKCTANRWFVDNQPKENKFNFIAKKAGN